jgi:hypothetical protein
MEVSALPASALVLPHLQTTYPTLRGNQDAVSSVGLLPSGRYVCTVTMNDYATDFLQEYQAVTESSKAIL